MSKLRRRTDTAPHLTNFYTMHVEESHFFVDSLPRQHSSPNIHEDWLSVSHVLFTLEIPNIFGTMFQPGRRPNGKLKRIKCSLDCTQVLFSIRETQTSTLLYSCMNAFGGIGNGYKRWVELIDASVVARCANQQHTEVELDEYMALFQRHRRNGMRPGPLQNTIIELESRMSLSLIMSLRRRVCKWTFPLEEDDNNSSPTGTYPSRL
jgi:hypothetical protein